MTSPADAKRGSLVDPSLQAHVSPSYSFNFMGLYTEIRLLIYKEVFGEFYVSEPLDRLEESNNDQKDSKTTSGPDGSDELVASDDWVSLGNFENVGDSGNECDSSDAPGILGDCYRAPDRVKLPAKLGLALASKTICAEALPILYETHHFNILIWEALQDSLIARKPPEDFYTYRHYFLRRNPMLVQHIKHLEILFELSYDHTDALDSGGYYLTLSLLQDIAAACPRMKTFRFATVGFPQEWIFDEHPRSDLGRDAAVACFRTFAQRGCRLEFQVAFCDSLTLVDFLDEIAPSDPQSGTWTITESGDSLYLWNGTYIETLRVWSLEYRRSMGFVQGGLRKE